jgi:hypothetical protein
MIADRKGGLPVPRRHLGRYHQRAWPPHADRAGRASGV